MFQCDICGQEGERYQITYREGVRILDRCPKHAAKIEAFKSEPGEWMSSRPSKSTFKKSSAADLKLALARSNGKQD